MITRLELRNFRSYEKGEFELAKAAVIVGGNGAGKSNLAEAVYLLATGKSFRADAECEMIRHGELFSRVIGEVFGEKMEILITSGSPAGGARKKYFVNGVAKRQADFVGIFRGVLFGPADLDLITGSPSGRRDYLDFVISQGDWEYRRSLISYEKGLRQRNRLLDLIREGRAGRHQLFFWDRLLIKNGEYLTGARGRYLQGLGNSDGKYEAEYDNSVISEARIKQYEAEEVAAGSTLIGPHRDDFRVKLEGRDVSKYGSRGEQRMAVLWLKMGERDYLTGERGLPTLILDDVFSELDHEHREAVAGLVEDQTRGGGQVIITTADEHLVPKIEEATMIRL